MMVDKLGAIIFPLPHRGRRIETRGTEFRPARVDTVMLRGSVWTAMLQNRLLCSNSSIERNAVRRVVLRLQKRAMAIWLWSKPAM